MRTDHVFTVILSFSTSCELEELQDFANVWSLMEQCQLEVCGAYIRTYTRDPGRLRIVSSWDIAYLLIERLLAMRENQDGQHVRVDLSFSDDPDDKVEITGAELLAEEPCVCARIEAGEKVSSHRQKEEGLEVFPHIDSLVSKVNPEP